MPDPRPGDPGFREWSEIRRVLVVFNPRSGKGRAAQIVQRLTTTLQRINVDARTIGLADALADAGSLVGAGAMVILGGDGTVRALAPRAIADSIPIYHFPMGTENLLAREFGMTRDPDQLLAALRAGRVDRVDAGALDGEPFVLMAGFGPDADVVRRLQARRGGRISHASYVVPILQTLARPRFPRLVVVADGTTLVAGRRGLLVVANSRQYGARLDPAPMASMTDGRLDVVFMPCASRTGALAWAAACRARMHGRRRGFLSAQTSQVEVQSLDGPLSIQVDGEPGPRDRDRVVIRVLAGAIPVLKPRA